MNTSDTRTDKQLWEDVAEDYIDFTKAVEDGKQLDYLRTDILLPTLFKYLGSISGKKILEAGCGEGLLVQQLEREGAQVIGIDASPKMIEAAQNRKSERKLEAEFILADLQAEGVFPEKSFDAIVVNLVFPMIRCVEQAFRNLLTYLNSGGRIVFSIFHPAFDFGVGPNAAFIEKSSGNIDLDIAKFCFSIKRPYTQKQRYERAHLFSHGKPVPYYFRNTEAYVNLFIKNDLQITGFFEPTLDKGVAVKDKNVTYAYFVPRFLIIGGDKK